MALNGKKKIKEVWVHREIWATVMIFIDSFCWILKKEKKGGGGSAFHSYE